MFGSLGIPELVIIMVIALIIFGPRKLPELGKALGQTIKEFKKSSSGLLAQVDDEIRGERNLKEGSGFQELHNSIHQERGPDGLHEVQTKAG